MENVFSSIISNNVSHITPSAAKNREDRLSRKRVCSMLDKNHSGNYRGKKPLSELLSEQQKKINHIKSEKKRRKNIKDGFVKLVNVNPGLGDHQKSEAIILDKSMPPVKLIYFL